MLRQIVIVASFIACTLARPEGAAPVELNVDSRPLVDPDLDSCVNRPKQWQLGDHWYFLSNNVSEYKDLKMDWFDARNLCRKHCMESVSIETDEENDMVIKLIESKRLHYVWTSGRVCNATICEGTDWYWLGSGVKVSPDELSSWNTPAWSQTGHFKRPQPDNAEFSINKTNESCLAVLNNLYKDKIKWHDIACYHKKGVICEDSPELLQQVSAANAGVPL